MDRILRQMRIGDMTLHTFDGQFSRHRAATAIFDGVAQFSVEVGSPTMQ
jgi:hypothetical protein